MLGQLILTLAILISTTQSSFAFYFQGYYSNDLISQIENHQLRDEALKRELFEVISENQNVLGYSGARKILFGEMYLQSGNNGYFIEDVYCQKKFGENSGVRPNGIPKSEMINCEHTWPQSKFTSAFPNEMQKSDLHHLYPSDSRANSIRGNLNFTNVTKDTGILSETNCDASKFGTGPNSNGEGFEPPTNHKGNVARSIFYFSIRYKMKIPANEETVLRGWDQIDPVDETEIKNNDIIEHYQGNRNPFVDFPGLANEINRFN